MTLAGESQKVHVVGLGRSGAAAARLLLRHNRQVIISDDADNAELRRLAAELTAEGAKVHLGGHQAALAQAVDMVVASPGVPWRADVLEARRKERIEVIAELELGWRFSRGHFAAITGSNGKTTTTALLGKIFSDSGRPSFTCGNIGLPLSDVADRTVAESFLALEVSSFQLEGIAGFRPEIAVLLNITPDHYDRHTDQRGYAQAKARLWMNQTADDWLIYFADDQVVAASVTSANSRKFPFSLKERLDCGAFADNGHLCAMLPDGSEFVMERKNLRLPGRHNSANALAAISAALLMGFDPEQVTDAIADFEGVAHRLEAVRELDGILWINDSKATNVDAGRWALEAVARPIILIAGGRAKGGGFKSLVPYATGRVKKLVLIGEAAEEIKKDLGEVAAVEMAGDLADAVRRARASASPGDAVLLSPLCASYDMFRNYEDRGDQFRRLVLDL